MSILYNIVKWETEDICLIMGLEISKLMQDAEITEIFEDIATFEFIFQQKFYNFHINPHIL